MAKRRPVDVALEPAVVPLEVPLPIEGLGSEAFWLNEIEQAQKRRRTYVKKWRINLDRYNGAKPALRGLATADTIPVNVDFYNSEQKKAQLFYQLPTLILTPKRTGTQGQSLLEAGVTEAAVLNHYLGADEIDAASMVDQVLSDVLVPAGVGFSKIGYESLTQRVRIPTGRKDPMTGGPALGPDGQPETVEVPKIVWSRYYWEEISPARALIPATLTTTRYEQAPWLGWEFPIDADRIGREYQIDRSLVIDGTQDDATLASDDDKPFVKVGSLGTELWYRRILYDTQCQSPDAYYRLVVMDTAQGRRVVVHGPSPYQKFDPVTGQLTHGMKGNPIHPCAIRSMTDTAIPNSDCTVSRAQVDELSMGRTQMVLQRKRNLPLRGFNKQVTDKATITAIERGEIQSMIPFDGPIQEQDFRVLANATYPRENFDFDTIINRDVEKMWALGSNQVGVRSGDETATAANLQQQASETRMAKERNRVLNWYLKGCQKLFALIQLFADEQQTVQIVGPDGQTRLQAWDKTTIAGEFAFDMHPDSSMRMDANERTNKFLKLYNLVANDPHFNRAALDQQLCAMFGLDPSLIMQQPPPPPPDQPKTNLSFKGDDLRNPLVLKLLKAEGLPITDEEIAAATAAATGIPPAMQPMGGMPSQAPTAPVTLPHGGRAISAQTIDKHAMGDGR